MHEKILRVRQLFPHGGQEGSLPSTLLQDHAVGAGTQLRDEVILRAEPEGLGWGQDGDVDPDRDFVLIGKERHDIGRPGDQGYPIRGIVSGEFLYVRNFEPERWPAGNPETGYLNCDGSPTKTVCLDARENPETMEYWEMSFGKRPPEELYRISDDRDCLNNLAENPEFAEKKNSLRERMETELKAQGDLRMIGRGGEYEKYRYADPSGENFYERYTSGEEMNTGWVNRSDFRGKIK